MQYKKNIYVVLVAIAVAAIGAALWWKLDEKSDVSPQVAVNGVGGGAAGMDGDGTSGSEADPSEWARRWAQTRDRKDLDSVVRSFKEANDCLAYHVSLREVDSILHDKEWDDLSRETQATLENMDASSARNVSVVRRLEKFCKGSDQRQLAEAFSSAIFNAALQGSPDAEACFVLVGPSPWQVPESGPSGKLEMDRYLKYAPAFSQRALERGDPRVAVTALYRYVASTPVHPSAIDDLPKSDPSLTWRVARLASLRALPEQRERIEFYLSEFGKKEVVSPSEITKADAWAAETYQREFSGQPSIDVDSPVQCYSSPDLAP